MIDVYRKPASNASRYGSLGTIPVTYDGYTYTLREWATLLKMPYATLRMRYARGKRGVDLFAHIQKRSTNVINT